MMKDSNLIFSISIGLIIGIVIASMNVSSCNGSIKAIIVLYLIESFFGALGSVSADMFIDYGPQAFGSSILPDFVGGLVIGLVALGFWKIFMFFA